MGWDFSHRETGMSTLAFLERDFPQLKGNVVASGMAGSTFYAAVRHPADPGRVFAWVVLTQRARGYHNFGYKDMDEGAGPCEARAPVRVLDALTPLPECAHDTEFCRHCQRPITADGDAWVSPPVDGQAAGVAGPQCFETYVDLADGGPDGPGRKRAHEPGGHGYDCRTCIARGWRKRCREHAAAIERGKAIAPGTVLRFAQPLDYGRYGRRQVLRFVQGTTFADTDGLRFTVPAWQTRGYDVEPAA